MALPLKWLITFVLSVPLSAEGPATRPADPAFERGLPSQRDYFPIAVWLQDPKNAAAFKVIGVNLYVGLWNGPTEQQLEALEKANMPVICEPTSFGVKNQNRRIIVGWMHSDEPDNAQSLGEGKGYGPPIEPKIIAKQYRDIRRLDPSRPVLLNLGQGVAWDQWYGRGVRTNHPEDYAQYAQGADILSFDIYPVTHTHKDITGHLWYVAQGVERLRRWSGEHQPVWACVETTHISNPDIRPTPDQIRSLVWMAVIHGAKGLLYFAHEFKPKFIEAGILAYPDIRQAVGSINAQITALAPALNAPAPPRAATVRSSNAAVPIDILHKQAAGAIFVFAVAMREGETTADFAVPGASGSSTVTVLGENRAIPASAGHWRDTFKSYAVHLYQLTPAP